MISLDEIKAYCKDKTICLVGNGGGATEGFQGGYIDSHDIVIRINGGVPILDLKEHMGEKFSLWVYSAVPHKIGRITDLDKKFNPDYILRIRCKINFLHKYLYHKTYFQSGHGGRGGECQDDDDFKHIVSILGKEPTTGCQAFHFLKRNIPYRKLSVVGFDFFETDNLLLGSVKHEGRYNLEGEKRFILSNLDEHLCCYDNDVIIPES